MQISTHISPYWLLLKDLSSNEKQSLIELLVKSLQSTNPTLAPKKGRRGIAEKSDWVQRFSGSWKTKQGRKVVAWPKGDATTYEIPFRSNLILPEQPLEQPQNTKMLPSTQAQQSNTRH